MKNFLLAHDLGTSGNKATLFTVDGRLVKSVTVPYGTHYFNTNWAEQDPEDWWKAVCSSTQELMRGVDGKEVAVISFSGHMMGCLCVGRDGRPLRPGILYCDQRGVKEEAEILSKIAARDFYRITGHRASASYSAAKLMWVKNNEPEIYARTFKMLHAKDYMNFRLTGVMASEYTDGSSTNLLDLTALAWSEKLVAITGLDGEKLPDLHPSTDVVGTLTTEAATALGLPAGIPVVAGGGDGLCAAVGVGSVKPGVTYNYLGSSSWIATTSEKPIFDEQMRTFVWAHAVPGYVHPCGTMQTAGGAYAWLKNEICTLEKEKAVAAGASPYELINEQIAASPPGANGLVFLPYLLGERTPRWNPDAKGALIGLTLAHTRADVLRAVMEGITLNLSIILDIFREQLAHLPDHGDRRRGEGRRVAQDHGRRVPGRDREAQLPRGGDLHGRGDHRRGGLRCVQGLRRCRQVHPDHRQGPTGSRPAQVYQKAKGLLNDSYDALEPLFPRFGAST